ncbi:MAG: alpha/beta fold hydrolase [Pseudomonadota bacterium]|nr:alpha/beta hydrolase [Pseudomonadales bacterium]MDY6918929.1 alpha/beta fold hydrolase [Pseudomonadota bacterium]
MNEFPAGETRLTIAGPEGDLQAITNCPQNPEPGPGNVTIVCHPHSLMGGTMNNKVVHTLARARRDLGHRVVRFNFRGVEQSQGQYDEGQGEQEDLLAVIDWVRQVRPDDSIWLAGFSFGSYVAAATCGRALERGDPVLHLLLVAPAVENYDFAVMTAFPCPLAVIYGEADEVVDAGEIARWAAAVTSEKQVFSLPEAGHFFHGRLTELKQIVQERLISVDSR